MVSETVSKGSLIGLAMVAVSAGINQVIAKEYISGIILLVVGFGFIMWREYLKAKYSKKREKRK